MRKSTRATAPLFVISLYYFLCIALFQLSLYWFPQIETFLPVGGIDELLERGADRFDVEVFSSTIGTRPHTTRLAIAMLSVLLLMFPISWVYFITTQDRQVDRSLTQTMLILPIIVAGIAMIVQNSIALAFSLAGIVAAVRFRFTLTEPAHTLYVFVAITIGLGAGISAVGISTVISITFVFATLLLWRLEYGKNLNSPFFSFLTGRDHQDDDR